MTGHTQYSHNKVQFAESLGPSTHHVAREVASLSDHGDEIVLYGAITACLLVLAVTKILLIFWSLSSIASETAIERYPATTMVSQQFRFRWTRRVCSYSTFFFWPFRWRNSLLFGCKMHNTSVLPYDQWVQHKLYFSIFHNFLGKSSSSLQLSSESSMLELC